MDKSKNNKLLVNEKKFKKIIEHLCFTKGINQMEFWENECQLETNIV